MASIRPHSLAHGHTKMAAAPLEVVYAAVARTPRQKDPGMAVGRMPRGWPKIRKGERERVRVTDFHRRHRNSWLLCGAVGRMAPRLKLKFKFILS